MTLQVIATEALPTAGALIYWRLEGGLDPAKLAPIWKANGLSEKELPATPAPSTALSRAVRDLSSKRTLIRPLEARAGHAVVVERASGDDLEHRVSLKVRLDPAGRAVCDPPDHPAAPVIKASYTDHLALCSSEDIGTWLCKVVHRLDGLSLRDTGGFYFLPPHRIDEWKRVVQSLEKVSAHRCFLIPAMRSQDAVRAVLDALDQEADTEATRLETELLEGVNGKGLGEKALNTRAKQCADVEAKVTRYEELLGTKLDGLRDRLEKLRGNIAAATLLALDEAS